jgi:hypothetical protein
MEERERGRKIDSIVGIMEQRMSSTPSECDMRGKCLMAGNVGSQGELDNIFTMLSPSLHSEALLW